MATKNLATLLQDRIYRFSSEPILHHYKDEAWQAMTWQYAGEKVKEFGRSLLAMGVNSGDRVLIVAESQPTTVLLGLACFSIGAVQVSFSLTNDSDADRTVLSQTEAKICFTDRPTWKRLFADHPPLLAAFPQIVALQDLTDTESPTHLIPFSTYRERSTKVSAEVFYQHLSRVEEDQVALMLYPLQGPHRSEAVLFTHRSLLVGAQAFAQEIGLETSDICMFPQMIRQPFEYTTNLLAPICAGAQVALSTTPSPFKADLKQVKPTLLICTEEMVREFGGTLRERLKDRPKLLLFLANKTKLDSIGSPQKNGSQNFFERWLFGTFHAQLGGRIRALISGGKRLPLEISHFLHMTGIRLQEGYTLAETSSFVAIEPSGNGQGAHPLSDVEIQVSSEGEFLIRGPIVMKGHEAPPGELAPRIDREGFLHSGDTGKLLTNGHLSIPPASA